MARTYATKANDKMQTSMERLSSGMRINIADDAAGLAVANKMTSQLSGNTGISLTAESGRDGAELASVFTPKNILLNFLLRLTRLPITPVSTMWRFWMDMTRCW